MCDKMKLNKNKVKKELKTEYTIEKLDDDKIIIDCKGNIELRNKIIKALNSALKMFIKMI